MIEAKGDETVKDGFWRSCSGCLNSNEGGMDGGLITIGDLRRARLAHEGGA